MWSLRAIVTAMKWRYMWTSTLQVQSGSGGHCSWAQALSTSGYTSLGAVQSTTWVRGSGSSVSKVSLHVAHIQTAPGRRGPHTELTEEPQFIPLHTALHIAAQGYQRPTLTLNSLEGNVL